MGGPCVHDHGCGPAGLRHTPLQSLREMSSAQWPSPITSLPPKTPIVIDCDPGVDDSMALLLAAASSSQYTLVGVTIVFGNNPDTSLLAANASAVLGLAGLSSIPIALGAGFPSTHPVGEPYVERGGVHVHSSNGVGGASLPSSSSPGGVVVEEDAVAFLARAAKDHPGLVVIALGPQTNIAATVTAHPEWASSIAVLSFMGGSANGVGNAGVAAEANVLNDPEAAAIVLTADFPVIVMAGLNVTRQIPLDDAFRTAIIDRIPGPIGDFVGQATKGYMAALAEWGFPSYVHDSTAVMALVAPHLFEASVHAVRVELVGELTRGMTVVDHSGGHHWGPEYPANVYVLQSVDTPAYYEEWISRVVALV